MNREELIVEALASDVHEEDGWLSDAQTARLEWDADNRAVRFHGEGSIDLAHLAEIASTVFEQAHTTKNDLAAFEKIAGVLYRDKVKALEEQAHTPTTPTDDERGWSTDNRREAEAEAKRRFMEWDGSDDEGVQRFGAGSVNGFILGAEWWKSRRTVQGEPTRPLTPCGNLVCTGCRVCGCPALGIEPQGEPTPVRFVARQAGKVHSTIDALLAQANEHGIRVEVVYPQGEPTDAQVLAEVREHARRWADRPPTSPYAMGLRDAWRTILRKIDCRAAAATHEGENRD